MTSSHERWAAVPGYEHSYQVSDHGRVRSLDREVMNRNKATAIRGVTLKASIDDVGYPAVTLWQAGKSSTVRVHRLVAKAFVPGEAEGLEVCHGDGDRSNNHYQNLRWDSRKANVADMKAHGTNFFSNVTHCPRGHEYDAANTIMSRGRRVCRSCRNTWRRRRRAETSAPRAEREMRDARILRLAAEGLMQSEIGAAVGMTQAGVCAALKRIGRPSQVVPYLERDISDELPVSEHEHWWPADIDQDVDRMREERAFND